MQDGRPITARQLAERLPDIPQASLYRHLNKLSESGILTVVSEQQIRGATEKTYVLHYHNANLTAEELKHATREDHLRYFMTFLASLQQQYEQYLSQDTFDLQADGVGYRQFGLYLTDEEFTRFTEEIRDVIQRAAANEPSPDRRRRLFTTILYPDAVNTPAIAPGDGREDSKESARNRRKET
ncbi:helix-turn-helix domain-containing protein [Brevibacillus humidisoli]|uniref:helix-turn-helix domain-containing protein n=1 Tax=Brevibacillus humidisoli TaxID=2895522 RepID=UPI001E5D583B|nr:helix-turn-helix domain-containing protein [Brevibacillus humidisoli]